MKEFNEECDALRKEGTENMLQFINKVIRKRNHGRYEVKNVG